MIKQETFTKENINRIVAKYKVDYELAARAVLNYKYEFSI